MIKKIINDKKSLLIITFDIMFSFLITLRICNDRIEIADLKNLNIWLFLLVNIFVFYISSHFLFKVKNVYDFIFKNRYVIALLVLSIIVLGKFNGSSIGIWNNYIQPSEDYSYKTIIGKNRAIRSDEWLVNTPYALSQKNNDFNYYNPNARASKTDMFSSIFTPVKSLLILTRPFNIVYILFGNDYGLSFYWYGRLIALLLISFEFIRLITKDNRILSLVGAIAITGSSVVSWWYSNYIVDLLISSELTLLLFNNYLKNNSKKNRILSSIGIGWSFSWFLMVLYPAWQIPLGYLSLLFAIYIFICNFNQNRSIKNYLYLLISVIVVLLFLAFYLNYGLDTMKIIMDTVYPGQRISTGGGYGLNNFTYIYSILFPFIDIENPCASSVCVSLFPVSILVSLYYLIEQFIKNKKNFFNDNLLIILLTLISVFFTLYTFVSIPEIIAKILLLSYVPSGRIIVILSIINLYLVVLLVGKLRINKWYEYLISIIFSIGISIFCVYISNYLYSDYIGLYINILLFLILFALIFSFLLSYRKKFCNLFMFLMAIIGISNLLFVNPINIGTDVIYKKDVANEIKKISNKNKDAIWISYDSVVLQNYALMNNAKVLNSTNIYPNLDVWQKIDKLKKYSDVYNRYAHIAIKFTDDDTKFLLDQTDKFTLYLNYDDIDKLNINYIISSVDLSADKELMKLFHCIYAKDGIYIYSI